MPRYRHKRRKNSAQFKKFTGLLRPPSKEAKRRLLVLVNELGTAYMADLLNISDFTLANWLRGITKPSRATLKLIWVLYGMSYAPHEVRTMFDLMTWGRFSDPAKKAPKLRKKSTNYTGYINPS